MFSCIFNIWNMPKGLLGWYTCSFSCFLSVKEGVWMTDSTPPSILFFRASGVKTEELFGALYPFTFVIVLVGFPFCWTTRWQDTLQIMLQLSEPGTVWCQNLSFTSDHGVNGQRCAVCSVLRSSGGDRERIDAFSVLPWGWDLVGSFSALLLGDFCEGLSITGNQLFASCSWSLHLHWSGDESYLEKKQHDLWRSPSSGLH